MSGVGFYFWLAFQALSVLVFFPPAGLLMLGGIVASAVTLAMMPADRWRQALIGALAPLALPAAILLCGVLLVHDTELDTVAPRWPEDLVTGLLLAHIPLGLTLAWRLRGVRMFALSVSVAVAGYSCGAAFMSIMSVSGRWL
jgi:hypothetical protein